MTGILAVRPEFVRAQIDAVVDDIGIDAAKTGMLANRRDHRGRRCRGARASHRAAGRRSGDGRAERRARCSNRRRARRAAARAAAAGDGGHAQRSPRPRRCSTCASRSVADMRDAARRLVDAGAGAALVKGGHLDGGEAVDVFDDGAQLHELRAPAHRHARIRTAPDACCRPRSPHVWRAACRCSTRCAKPNASSASPSPAAWRSDSGNGPANPLAWLPALAAEPGIRRRVLTSFDNLSILPRRTPWRQSSSA